MSFAMSSSRTRRLDGYTYASWVACRCVSIVRHCRWQLPIPAYTPACGSWRPGRLTALLPIALDPSFWRSRARASSSPLPSVSGHGGRGVVYSSLGLLEKIAVTVDVCSEIERVLTGESLRQLRIPPLQGFDDFQMIDDGAGSAVTLRH